MNVKTKTPASPKGPNVYEYGCMKAQDTVKYCNPLDELESSFRFVVLHVEKGKADIQLGV